MRPCFFQALISLSEQIEFEIAGVWWLICAIQRLQIDFFSTEVWASMHIKRTSSLFSFKTVQKIYDLHLRLRLMLETRVRCTAFVARQSYQRGEKFLQWAWNYKFTSLSGEIQQAGASETAGKNVSPCFTLVSDYKRLDTRSYFIMPCKTFCFACFYRPAFCRVCVFIVWTSCLVINK